MPELSLVTQYMSMNNLSNLFNPTVIAEWIAFLAALRFLPQRVGVWRLFVLLLLATILVETGGWYSTYIWKKSTNQWIFNILMLVSNAFWIWIFRFAEPMHKAGRPLRVLFTAFVCFGLANLLFFQGFWVYNSYTDIFGDLLVAVVCCYFFYASLQEELFRDFLRYEYFWLANGLLFSSLGSMVLYIFIDYLYAFKRHTQINVYGYINYGLNIILYGSFVIAFICRNRNTRSSPG
jgi:drug/metabolite transporter superfamily protein YnfA